MVVWLHQAAPAPQPQTMLPQPAFLLLLFGCTQWVPLRCPTNRKMAHLPTFLCLGKSCRCVADAGAIGGKRQSGRRRWEWVGSRGGGCTGCSNDSGCTRWATVPPQAHY